VTTKQFILILGLMTAIFLPVELAGAEEEKFQRKQGVSGDDTDTLSFYSREQLENRLLQYDGKVKDLAERVAELEKGQKESYPSWLDRFTFKGDFRYRYEMIDEEGNSHRNRNRIRARLFAGAKVNDLVDVGIQLATTNENPVSTNETLGDGWSGVSVRFDCAYFDFHPFTDRKDGVSLNLIGGKMKTPFAVMSKSELLWDPDLRPEGIALELSKDLGALELFANAGGFYLRENKSGADTGMFGGQLGSLIPIRDHSLTVGAGFYDYTNIEGETVFDHKYDEDDDDIDDADFKGNTNVPNTDRYEEDYDELELFGEYAFEVMDLPVHLFGNLVENIAADDDNRGYLAGIKVGKAKEPGSWDFRYQWKNHEENSVVGAFSDSDFAGGGTDAKGHEFNVGYMLAKNCKLALTYFMVDTALSNHDRKEYERFQLDLKLSF